MKLIKSKNYEEMCAKVARIFAAQITLKPDSVLGLATGSTPIGMYQELVRKYNEDRVDFGKRVHRPFRRQRPELPLFYEPQPVWPCEYRQIPDFCP